MKQHRWKCGHCGAEGWGSYQPHDKRDGQPCRDSGMITEREARHAVDRHIKAMQDVLGPRWKVEAP